MAGELWRGYLQLAKESSYGAGTQPATRRGYYEDASKFTNTRQPRPHAFATATRDNVRSFTVGPQEVAGTLIQPLSSSEIVELFLMNLAGGITPTQPNAGTDPTVYLWTFKPGNSLDSAAIEYHDGANPWLVSGVLCDVLNIKGVANAPNVVTATMFGKVLDETTMTGGLTERTPDITEGFETSLYIDSFGGTPGTTLVNGFLVNWDITLRAGLQRKYLAANSNSLASVPLGVLGCEAVLTFEAAPANAEAEYDNWNVAVASPTNRLVRLDFGENVVISHAYKRFTTIDIPGAWSAFLLGETDAGTRVYRLTMQYVYDPTNTFGVQVRLQNDRATAWV